MTALAAAQPQPQQPPLHQRLALTMASHQLCAQDVQQQTGVQPHLLARWLQHQEDGGGGAELSDLAAEDFAPVADRLERWLDRLAKRASTRRPRGVRGSAKLVPSSSSSTGEELIPIRLELTMLQPQLYKTASGVATYSDAFMWSLDSALTPRAFITQTLRDLHMEAHLWLEPLVAQMVAQIESHRAAKGEQESMDVDGATPAHAASDAVAVSAGLAALAALVGEPSTADSDMVQEVEDEASAPQLIKIELDIIHNSNLRLQDSVLWDPLNPHGDPDLFAHHYVRDQGLPSEFAAKIAWAIREQLAVATPTVRVPSSAAELLRPAEAMVEFTPMVRGLTVRHHIAVNQRPAPPYIALYVPSTHRHALYLGEVVDARNAPPPPSPAPIVPRLAATTLVFSVARLTEDRVHLLRRRVRVDDGSAAAVSAPAALPIATALPTVDPGSHTIVQASPATPSARSRKRRRSEGTSSRVRIRIRPSRAKPRASAGAPTTVGAASAAAATESAPASPVKEEEQDQADESNHTENEDEDEFADTGIVEEGDDEDDHLAEDDEE